MIEIITAAMAAGETKTFMMQGEYIEVLDALNPVDIFMMDRSGAQLSTMRAAEASFFSRPGKYEVVQVYSATAQTIRLFIGSGDAGTRRAAGVVSIAGTVATTGTVEVVDGGKARTKANLAFMGIGSLGGAASVNAHVQLWNPVGSGKNLIVERLTAVVDTGAVYFGMNAAALPTPLGAAKSKLAGGAVSVGLIYNQNIAAAIAPLGAFTAPAGVSLVYPLLEPIVLPPGNGLVCWANSPAQGITALFEFFQE